VSTDPEIGSDAERGAQGVVELIVPEFAETLAFYAAIGFEVGRLTADFVALQGYGCRLFLARDRAAQRVHGCNLRIVVDDVDAVYAQMMKADASILREPSDRGYGLRDFSVIDPNGFVLRFAQVINVTAS